MTKKEIIKIYFFFSTIFFYYVLYKIKKYKNEITKLNITNELLKIYTDLYDSIRNDYIKPRFLNFTKDYSSKQKNINICICSIGKKENLYIREFVEYYFSLKIDKLFIYDNNDIDGENFGEKLNDYIKNKFVEIIDVRGLSSIQIPIYNYCYQKNKNLYDWIGFLDFDEYLYIENNESIKDYFYNNRFNKCQTIFFNWIIYNDNNLIYYDNNSLTKRFTHPTLNYTQGKSFVRGQIDHLLIPTTMIPGINVFHFCNSNGELIYPKNFYENIFENSPKAYIKHFYTKTAEEFCSKLKKGNAHFHKNHKQYIDSIKNRINFFFQLNKKTKEKENILKKCVILK